MVFRAKVIDNSNFIKTGKIRVRLNKDYYGNKPSHNLFLHDLGIYPNEIKEGLKSDGLKHVDTDVRVFSPIGGGQDYGLFFLPQVNTDGIVLRIGESFDNSNDYLWLGSTFDMVNNTIKMPGDTMTNVNGIENKTKNISILDGALVIKLKSTKLEDAQKPENSKDNLDWKKSPIENLIVINKNKVYVNHSIIENKKIVGYETLTMDEKGTTVECHSDTNNTDSLMKLGVEGSFALQTNINKSQTTVRIEGTDSGIEMISNSGNNSSIINQNHDSVNINTKGTGVNISNGVVNIKSTDAIYLDAKNVNLGPAGLRVVLANVGNGVSSVDCNGVNLQFSSVITG